MNKRKKLSFVIILAMFFSSFGSLQAATTGVIQTGSVTTDAVTQITETTATLNGHLILITNTFDNGQQLTFVLSKQNGAAGERLPGSSSKGFAYISTLTSSSGKLEHSFNVNGLMPGTTYYVQLGAQWNQNGQTEWAAPVSFTTLPDVAAPDAGAQGIINTSAAINSINLNWTAASDNFTLKNNLKYKVVYSKSNDLNDLSSIETNGTTAKDWTANLTSMQVTGLEAGTTYYFNVIVKDEAGNKSIYAVSQAALQGLTYELAPINNETMTTKIEGYEVGTQETKTITITKAGTGDLQQIKTELSGGDADKFELTQPLHNILTNTTTSTTFTIRAKDGLAKGIYTAEVIVSAESMASKSFTVTQAIAEHSPLIPILVSAVPGDGEVTLTWSPAAGATSYKIYKSEASNTYSIPSMTVTDSIYSLKMTGLTNGKTYYFVVKATNAAGDSPSSIELNAVPRAAPSSQQGGTTTSGGGGNTVSAPSPSGIIVIVNGQKQTAGTRNVKEVNGKKTAELIVNGELVAKQMEEVLKQQSELKPEDKKAFNNIVVVSAESEDENELTTSLTGDIIKKMDENAFKLSVKAKAIDYIIPAKEIGIDLIAEKLGVSKEALKEIKVEVKMNKLSEAAVKQIKDTAQAKGYKLVFEPVDFTVAAKTTSADGRENEVTISKFTQYVERTVEIPAGVDVSKITTGIVLNADGSFSHVPTHVFKENNKYYAKLNSLTNSIYSVISNPIEVAAVENHWSKESVNDMASRLVIKNPESFEPNGAITRGEFAEYITKALGLYRTEAAKANQFSDVEVTDELANAITIASEYGIISGYADGSFKPDAKVSRQEAMNMYAKAMDIVGLQAKDNGKIASYKDQKQVGKWAYASVQKAVGAGIFNGRTKDTIEPKGTLTYAEAASAIRNLLQESALINK